MLCFLSHPTIPFPNTQAERDTKAMKLLWKSPMDFRPITETADFAAVSEALSTATRQGWNVLRAFGAHAEDSIADWPGG